MTSRHRGLVDRAEGPPRVWRRGRRAWIAGVASALAFLSAWLFCGMVHSGDDPSEDPLPLRRIVVPPSRIAAELERSRLGLLIPLPRAELEARLQQVGRMERAAQNPPRLVQARYVAELVGNALVGRTGVWKVHRDGELPGVLPLGQFNLALGTIRDARDVDALLGDLDSRGPGLWVPKSSEFYFDWSARGTPRVDGLAFDLRLPAATAGTLELILPAEYSLAAGVPVSGPRDAEDRAKRTWLLQIGGQTKVELSLRRTEAEKAPGLFLVHLQSHVQVWPRWFAADFEFQVDLAHTSASELRFVCDSGLDPYEVIPGGADLLDWQVNDRKTPDARKKDSFVEQRVVTLRFRNPVRGTLAGLKVRCLGVWSGKAWTCPGVHLEGALFRGESLKLAFSPEVQVQDWSPGALRLVSAAAEPGGAHTLHLTTNLLELGNLQRPSAILATQNADLHAKHALRWDLLPEKQKLVCDCMLSARRGLIHQVHFRLPTGPWRVTKLELEPKEQLEDWHQDGAALRVDLKPGLAAPGGVRVVASMERAFEGSHGGVALDFPQLELPQAVSAEASLAIALDASLQGRVVASSQSPAAPTSIGDKRPPLFFFPADDQKLSGRLFVKRAFSRAAVVLRHDQLLEADQVRTSVKVEVESLAGRADTLELYSSVAGVDWRLRDPALAGGARLERLPERDVASRVSPLAAATPLDLLTLGLPLWDGEWWRVHLPPGVDRAVVELTSTTPLPKIGLWRSPLLLAPDAAEARGALRIRSNSPRLGAIRLQGLAPGPDEERTATDGSDHVFQFSSAGPAPALWAELLPHTPRSAMVVCDRASWITYVEADRDLVHHLRFRLWGWRDRRLGVTLPIDATLVWVRVDDRWQSHVDSDTAANGRRVNIPMTFGDGQRVEIVYRTPGARFGWSPLAACRSAPPQVAVAPLYWDRIWRLHPDLVPLHQERYQALSPLERYPTGHVDLGKAWHAADGLVQALAFRDKRADHALQQVLAAENTLRKKLNSSMRLADALELLLLEGKVDLPVVVDRAALAEAGVGPLTPLGSAWPSILGSGRPFWESLGLTIAPGTSELVLTTTTTAQAFERLEGPNWLASRRNALAEAALGEGDSSGVYLGLVPWLFELAPGLIRADDGLLMPVELSSPREHGWREYRPQPGLAAPDQDLGLVVAHVGALRVAGLATAAVLAICLFWWLRRPARVWKARLLIVAIAIVALAFVRLPETLRVFVIWPLVTLLAGLGVAYLGFLKRPPTATDASSVRQRRTLEIASAFVVFTAFGHLGAIAQPAPVETHTMLLLETAPGKETALVTPDLLKRLEEIEARARPRSAHAMLLAARYQGRWQAGALEVSAAFDIDSTAESADLLLPLTGVELKEGALLDGAAVYPVPAKGGLQVSIKGAGRHRLDLVFVVRLATTVDYRELRFSVPRLARSRLALSFPASLGPPSLVACQGRHTIDAGPEKTTRLQADLGREGVVHVRFPPDTPPGPLPIAEVREMYVADFRPLALSLNGVLQYSVPKGTISQLAIDIPEGTDVRQVELVVGGVVTPPKRWIVVGKEAKRQLQVDAAGPLSGKFQVHLALIPRLEASAGQLSLRLPHPSRVKLVESTLGYRLEGVEARETPEGLTYTVIPPEQFARFWQAAGGRDAAVGFTRAVTFRRFSPAASFLLTLTAFAPQAAQELAWSVRGGRADLAASLHLSASNEDVSLVQWKVPKNLHIASLRGPAMRHWSRKDDIVQIWLRQPQKKMTLTLSAWLRPAAKASAAKPADMLLPTLAVPFARVVDSTVRVAPAPGWTVAIGGLKGLKPAPAEPGVLNFRVDPAGGDPSVLVRPRAGIADGWTDIVTHVRRDKNEWRVRIEGTWHGLGGPAEDALTFEIDSAAASLRTGADVIVDPHGGVKISAWTLRPRSDGLLPVSFQIDCRLGDAGRLVLPELRVNGRQPQQRLVVLHGGAQLEKADDLAPHKLTSGETAWRIPAVRRDALAVVAPDPGTRPRLIVGPAQHHAVLTLEGRWLQQCAYLVWLPLPMDLRFLLPADARLRAAWLDGETAAPRPDDARLLLSIPAGLHRVALTWDYPGEEAGASPRLSIPRIDGVPDAATVGSVSIPPGWRGATLNAADAMVQRHFAAAQSLLRIAAAAQPSKVEGRHQDLSQQAARHLRLADHGTLALDADAAGPWRKRLATLRKEIARLEASRELTTERRASTPPSMPGVAWRGPVWFFATPAQTDPRLDLTPLDDVRQLRIRRYSELIVVVLFALLILSFLPRGQALFRATWPEHLVVFSLLGTLAWGVSLVGLVLLAAGLLSRAAHVLHQLSRRILRRRAVAASDAAQSE